MSQDGGNPDALFDSLLHLRRRHARGATAVLDLHPHQSLHADSSQQGLGDRNRGEHQQNKGRKEVRAPCDIGKGFAGRNENPEKTRRERLAGGQLWSLWQYWRRAHNRILGRARD